MGTRVCGIWCGVYSSIADDCTIDEMEWTNGRNVRGDHLVEQRFDGTKGEHRTNSAVGYVFLSIRATTTTTTTHHVLNPPWGLNLYRQQCTAVIPGFKHFLVGW